jgi:hypothetical protein
LLTVLIFKPFKLVVSLFVTIAVLYFTFFVKLGDKTLWEHGRAIVSTPEAQSLGQGMKQTGEQVVDRAAQEMRNGLHGADAGTPATTSTHRRRGH